MDAAEIARRLLSGELTLVRLRKAQALAIRSQVPWVEVLALVPDRNRLPEGNNGSGT